MFAITFDLVVADTSTQERHASLHGHRHDTRAVGFDRVQGSVYATKSDDMANLFQAILALRALPWFSLSVRDIRAFRIE
jgi:virulence-associated protein VapD